MLYYYNYVFIIYIYTHIHTTKCSNTESRLSGPTAKLSLVAAVVKFVRVNAIVNSLRCLMLPFH
jgi:hypothetical protein